MPRFTEIMETVFKWEGGYADHPEDKGGPTNFGITHKVLAKWRGVASVTKQEVRDLTKPEAEEIFKDRYFDVIKGSHLPRPIDLIMMDGAVNHGPGTMARFLEDAAGLTGNGRLSVAEAKKVAGASREELVRLAVALAEARKTRYLEHPKAQFFLAGWRNRLNDVMATAMADLPGSWSFAGGYDATGTSGLTEPNPQSSLVPSAIDDEDLQIALRMWGFYKGEINGLFDQATSKAVNDALVVNDAIISGNWRAWDLAQRKIAIGQLICHGSGIDVGRIDGLFGPRTEIAFDAFNRRKAGLPEEDNWRDTLALPGPFNPAEPTKTTWPRQKDVPSFFGAVCKPPLKRLHLPFEMKIAWDLNETIDGFMVHEKVHDSAARVFDRVFKEYGDDGIEDLGINLFGGCYNCRLMKGGSKYSMHSWAIAIDFDPERNRLKWNRMHARLAKPDAVKFWEFWEAEGWLSLGRARDFDWMHVQAARL
ncbi:glycosyl hydrolase 108 family protein [Roseibium aggregatum]|uniref:TtsA-like Glycoside hydrolase family 108 domain-containing protein n=1 Tax=Roseibium aggregatum TaxID=187304 RepID=A0A939EJL1_9HYPH|nr:glycosyl hydrolase 108 family protein [Roseibium aggregatum]MBN9673508.1 hypothetical protein [Roseibium aggregatum]